MHPEVRVIGITGVPEVRPGDDLARLLVEACRRQGTPLQDGDVLVVTQKVVSKAEGRLLLLAEVEPSPFARAIAERWGKDPRLVETVLRESRRIVRMDQGVLIAETGHGFICANAGVDTSNLPEEGMVSLLPLDPDASAQRLREGVRALEGVEVAVVITDTFGRPWREGTVDVAIGVAGMAPLLDHRGRPDAYGRLLRTSVTAVADEVASTAHLVCGKDRGIPAAIVRGWAYPPGEGGARLLVRPPERDLFR